jgi:hypothetical protein
MADKKISQLTAASTPLAGTEVLPIVQSGATVKIAVSDITAGRAVSGTQFTASTGNFILGTSGKGIDFSATAGAGTSELLNDYEEGTWTPIVTDLTNDATMDASSVGFYTKIGRQVTFTAYFSMTSAGSMTGPVYLKGLPFFAAISFARGSISVGYMQGGVITANQVVSGFVQQSNQYVLFSIFNVTTGSSQLTATQIGSTGSMVLSGTYFV